jgi:hypothetical protein
LSQDPREFSEPGSATRRCAVATLLAAALLGAPAFAQPLPDGAEVIARVNARDEGVSSRRRVTMELIDKRGGTRTRETVFLRRFFDGVKRTAVFFESPPSVKGTAFLTFDWAEPDREDDQWLYLPTLRRSRRISAADRGDSFVGTDLSYDDIKQETKVSQSDYVWETVGEDELDGVRCLRLVGLPSSEKVARELDIARIEAWIDADIWIARQVDYWDRAERHKKTSRISEIRQVGGIWTPHRIDVHNHRSDHRTVFTITQVDYDVELPEEIFTERALRRGPPAS